MFAKCLSFALLVLAPAAEAIVIRADLDDGEYRVPAAAFPALADLPGEGHGVLVAPRWVLTAAHAVGWQPEIRQVTINGVPREVERVVFHPGYRKPPQALADQALASWDWTLFRVLLASSDDIALVKLAAPVTDVAPVARHAGDGLPGQRVRILGKGATGNGSTGFAFSDPHRTDLREAENVVTSADGRWFCYRFDAPPEALPREGGTGSGDSGGPVLAKEGEAWVLAGLASWVDPQSAERRPGRYGQFSCNVRLGHYRDSIDRHLSEPTTR